MTYIKQLDSIRAIAVILVIFSHWIPTSYLINRIPIGGIGVDIFFVLSGFLISKILFENRNKADELKISKLTVLRNFYVRRTLRIFPIYYLTIFILLFFSKSTGTNIQSSFVYLLTYTSNFYFFNIQSWDGLVSHLWSLAVEEQFYLIWPWVILYFNKKYFLHIIFIFIFIGVLSQYLMDGINMSSILTITCFDAFGIGAILSWVVTYSNERLKKIYFIISVISAISFFFFVLGSVQNSWKFIPLRTLISLITLWIITYIMINHDTSSLRFKFILNNKILIFFR
jgi:peptidoglycan/LPS O-acetylase OafA/YrhL